MTDDSDCNAKEYDRCRSCGSRFETDDFEGIALDECINCEQQPQRNSKP
jgi:hypothetical protein